MDFFRSLPEEPGVLAETGETSGTMRSRQKLYSDLAMQEGILLFCLKGEIRKLGTHLETDRRAALEAVCGKLRQVVDLAYRGAEGAEIADVAALLQEVYDEMTSEAGRLGVYGGPVQYLADAVKAPVRYL